MKNYNINEILPDPISIRSHFLFSAPIIALGYNYKKDYENKIKSDYTLLHEYLHYENFIHWPFLGMPYFWKTFVQLYELYNFKYSSKRNFDYKNKLLFYWNSKNFNFKTKYSKITRKNFEIEKIGSDILIESTALLNYLRKPKSDIFYSHSKNIADSLLNNDLSDNNLIHKVGVHLMIDIKNDLIKNLSKKSRNMIKYINELPATIPTIIAVWSFGYSMVLNGFKNKCLEWTEINDFIVENYQEVWNTYINKIDSIFNAVLLENRYDEFSELLKFRDLSIIGYHCFMQETYLGLYNHFSKIFKENNKLLMIFLAPLLNILKYFEALYRPALIKSKVQKLFEHFTPIPVLLFSEKNLTSIRIENSNKDNLLYFKWSGSLKYKEDFYPMLSWLVMMFYNSFFDSIQNVNLNFECPIRKWVGFMFYKLGCNNVKNLDTYCSKLCNNNMKLTTDFEPINNKLNPTENFCRFDLISKDINNNQKCLFHNTINSIINL